MKSLNDSFKDLSKEDIIDNAIGEILDLTGIQIHDEIIARVYDFAFKKGMEQVVNFKNKPAMRD